MVCDEPRILDNQLISLGCLVTRGIRLLIYIQDKKQLMKFFTIDICFTFLLLNLGPDWQYGDQDGGAGNIGSVFQVAENGIVHVWYSHSFGYHNVNVKIKYFNICYYDSLSDNLGISSCKCYFSKVTLFKKLPCKIKCLIFTKIRTLLIGLQMELFQILIYMYILVSGNQNCYCNYCITFDLKSNAKMFCFW